MNKKRKITEGILFVLVLVLCAGIRGFFLNNGQIQIRDEEALYEASMIRDGGNEPVMTSGAVFAYTEILGDVLKFTGNKLEAVAMLQLLLQCVTAVLLYSGCRLLSGSAAALLEALFFSVCPFFLDLVFQASAENTYMALFAFSLLLVGRCCAAIRGDGFYRRSRDEFLVLFTGLVFGVLLIWHMMTVFLVAVYLFTVAGNAGQIRERRRGFKNRKSMEELLAGAKESERTEEKQAGEKEPMGIPAHILILLGGIFLGGFVTLMKYTGITGNTLAGQVIWWIHSFSDNVFQGLHPVFVFLLPGSVLISALIQLLINRVSEGKKADVQEKEEMPVIREENREVEVKEEKKKINYIENPLPGPKKHVKRKLDFKLDKRKDDFDIDIEEGDDFDI